MRGRVVDQHGAPVADLDVYCYPRAQDLRICFDWAADHPHTAVTLAIWAFDRQRAVIDARRVQPKPDVREELELSL